jgi:nicotinamidase-related amidase
MALVHNPAVATVRAGDRPVLLVVDVQVGVMAELWESKRVIRNVARAVERARESQVPVVWVQHEQPGLERDSSVWQLVPELSPRAGEPRVFKKFESSFEQTELEDTLNRLGATHLFVAGAMTNWCVRATSYGALDRGYDLTLLADAHTTSSIDLGNGAAVEARGMVADLNVAMTWLRYPGRTTSAAKVDEAQF